MSFSIINKNLLILTFFFITSSCTKSNVYETLKIKTYKTPIVESFEENANILITNNDNKINYENKIILKEFKNNTQFSQNVIIINNEVYALNKDIDLLKFNLKNGDLVSSKKIAVTNIDDNNIISFNYVDDSFILAFKSGSILRFNMNGKIIWKFDSNKTLNSPLKIIDEQIIALYVDEIKSIKIDDGSQIWFSIYEDLPIYQAKGGQLVNFLNLLYFILPNNKFGSIDLNLGLVHYSNFDDMPLISSINNTKDKIHIFNNYLVYLDEGKYLYTFDIFKNEFILFKKNIDISSSNIFFNNSLILKEGDFLQAINIDNGKTFWLIQDKVISKKNSILAAKTNKKNIEIFLDNGDVIVINNKELIKIDNLDTKKISNITFKKQNIIVSTESGKTVIF